MICRQNKLGFLIGVLLIVLFTTNAKSGTIKGFVLDVRNREPLIGAPVYNKDDNNIHDVAGLDGSYAIKNLKPGTYTIIAQFAGYAKMEQTVVISGGDDEFVKLDFLLEPQTVNLSGVTVVGTSKDKESDDYARSIEKNSDNVMNVLSAKTIQLLPDVNVGSIMQRMSGVTVEKTSSGDGRYATIRGMDKRYNYTMIDGVKIPSPDDKGRYVPLDIFPGDILERLEVIKSLTPSMEGDAIGGVTNMVLKTAPDHFICDANFATGYSQQLINRPYESFNTGVINNKSPQQLHPGDSAKTSQFPLGNYNYKPITAPPNALAGLTIGNRFFNNKLGVIVAGSFQNTYSGTSSLFIVPAAQPGYSPANLPEFDDIQIRQYSLQQQRAAVHTKIDYQINPRNKISYYTLYASLDQVQQRQYSDTVASTNAGETSLHYWSRVTNQYIYNNTLKGMDSLTPIAKGLTFDWIINYAVAGSNTPDWGTYSSLDGQWNSMTRRWANNSDKNISFFGNLTYAFKLFGQNVELKAGGMDRNKNRDNYYNQYDFNLNNKVPFGPISTIPYVTINPIQDPLGSINNALNYSFEENVNAYYGQAKFSVGPRLELLGGVRMENTMQVYNTRESVYIAGYKGTKSYSDILPSAQAKYKLAEKHTLRASYFSSLSRPSFNDIVPYNVTGDYFTEAGNPYLVHTQAQNYDLRYEWFPKPTEQVLAGVFYKNINNPIEYTFVRPGNAPSSIFLEPSNPITNQATQASNATNFGFEAVVAKNIKYFGISANYTYTKSQINVPDLLYYHDPVVGNTQETKYENRPLQGQAANIFNISGNYKNPKIGTDFQVSVVYTGKLISIASADYGLDYWQMPYTRCDLSFEQRLSKKIKLSLYGKVNNLFNAALINRIESSYVNPTGAFHLPDQTTSSSILVQKELFGQTYLLGIRYKF